MAKSADAFRTISEVAEWMDTPAHVLRFWESKFTQIKPVKRAGGRRYYRPADMRLLGGIKKLLHEDGMTIKGAQKILREQGIKHVASLCTLSVGEDEDVDVILIDDVPEAEPIDTVVPFVKPAEEQTADVEPVALQDEVSEETAEETEVAEVAALEETASEELPPSEEEAPSEEIAASETVALEEEIELAFPEADEPTDVADDAELDNQPSTEPEPEEPAALPGFLQRAMETSEPEHEAPEEDAAPAATEVAPPPEPEEPRPSALTYLAQIKTLPPESVQDMGPIVERLRALCA